MDILQLINTLIEYKNNEILDTDMYIRLKRKCIDKINESNDLKDILIEDIYLILNENFIKENKVPQEAYFLVALDIIKDKEEEYKQELIKLKNIIRDIFYNDNQFSISYKKLIEIYKIIINDKSNYSIIKCKLNRLTLLSIENDFNPYSIKKILINIDGCNKRELFDYYNNFENYYFLPNSAMEIFDFSTLNKLEFNIKVNNKDNISNYDYLNNYFVKNGYLDIKEQNIRILILNTINELLNGKKALNYNLMNELIKYKSIFKIDKLIEELPKGKLDYLNNYISKIKEEPNVITLRKLINEINNAELLFNLFIISNDIINNIDIDTKLLFINKLNYLEYHDIKFVLFCEKTIKETPIILDEIVSVLENIYEKDIFTENSQKTLEYIRCTNESSNILLDLANLRINSKNKKFDSNFINYYLSLYKKIEDKNFIDNITNSLINYNGVLEDKMLIKPFWDFYEKYNDKNALKRIFILMYINKYNNKENIKLREKEIISIWNFIFTLEKNNKYINYLLEISNEYIYNNTIRNKIINYIKSFNIEDKFYKNYSNLILLKQLYKYDDYLIKLYINAVSNEFIKSFDEDDISFLMKKVNDENNERSLDIEKTLIKFFIIDEKSEKYIELLNKYIKSNSNIDNGEFFKELIILNKNNKEVIYNILKNTDFNEIKGIEFILKSIIHVIKEKDSNLLIYIIDFYLKNNLFNDAYEVAIDYIENTFEISEFKYYKYIYPIFYELDNNKKVEFYKKLIKREDLDINFRVENCNLHYDKENEKIIAEEFLNGNTLSEIGKEIAFKYYYNDDFNLLKIISKGKSNKKVLDMLYNKVKEGFNNPDINTIFLKDLLFIEKDKDENLNKIYEHLTQMENESFNIYEINTFRNFKVKTIKEGILIKNVNLIDVFTSDVIENLILFKYSNVANVIKNYMDNNEVKYRVIGKTFYEIKESEFNYERSVENLLYKIKKLINLQRDLNQNNTMIIDFFINGLKEYDTVFIPLNLYNLREYKNNLKVKYTQEFNIISHTKSKYIDINENNIVILIKKLIEEYVKKEFMGSDEQKIISKLKDYIIENININSYEELIRNIDEFLEEMKKDFEKNSLRKNIKIFKTLDNKEKEILVRNILNEKEISLDAKKLIINYDNDIENFDNYLEYLLTVFNESRDGINEGEFCKVYEKILKFINEYEYIESFKKSIVEMFINSSKITGISKEDIKLDLISLKNINDDDKSYILRTMEKY